MRDAFSAVAREHRRQLLVMAPVLLLAIFAAWRVTDITRDDLRFSADSAVYLGTADNLRAGHGPTVPFTVVWDRFSPRSAVSFGHEIPSTHYPPGYPAVLAVVSGITGSARHAARVVDVVLIAANVLLVGWLTARLTNYRSVVVAAIPPLLCLLVPDQSRTLFEGPGWFGSHTTVASEPMFMMLFTAALIALGATVIAGPEHARRSLVVAAVLGALALATRYSGAALLLAGVLALGWFDRAREREGRDRAVRAGVYAAIVAVPTLCVVVAVSTLSGEGARPLSYHPIAGNAQRIIELFGRYLFPGSWTAWVRTAGLFVVLAVVITAAVRLPPRAARFWSDDERGRVLVWCSLLSVWVFADVVMASRAFFDPAVPIDARIFAPARGVFLAVVIAVLYRLFVPYAREARVSVALVVYALGVVYAGWSTQRHWIEDRTPRVERTPAEDAVAALPRDALIVSTESDQVYLKTGRGSYVLPSRFVYLTNARNQNFDTEVKEWAAILRERGGYVLYAGVLLSLAGVNDLRRYVELQTLVSDGRQSLSQAVRGP